MAGRDGRAGARRSRSASRTRDGFDERPFARAVAARFGTEHHEFVVHPNAVELIERLVWHHDQPFGDSSAVPTFLLSEVARGHVTVALSGDGGDELFAGYERFAAGLAVDGAAPSPEALRRQRRARDARCTCRPALRVAARAASSASPPWPSAGMPWAYLEWISYVPEAWRRRLCSHEPMTGRGSEYAANLGSPPPAPGRSTGCSALNLDTYLLDDLLVKIDRMSMAHGLEVRSPFLDTALVEFASRLAPSLKVRGTVAQARAQARASATCCPRRSSTRPKRGFGVPLDRWFREDLDELHASHARRRAHACERHLVGRTARPAARRARLRRAQTMATRSGRC